MRGRKLPATLRNMMLVMAVLAALPVFAQRAG